VLKPTSALHESPVHVDPYCVRIYSLDLPQAGYVRPYVRPLRRGSGWRHYQNQHTHCLACVLASGTRLA